MPKTSKTQIINHIHHSPSRKDWDQLERTEKQTLARYLRFEIEGGARVSSLLTRKTFRRTVRNIRKFSAKSVVVV